MQVSLFTDGDRTGCVKLQAPELSDSDSPPRVVVGVLDGSGSMDGKPLQDAKLALQWVVRQLRHDVDSFGLVYFSNEAKLQIPVTVVTDTNSLAMRPSIASLQTTGSTNLEAGLRLARARAAASAGARIVRSRSCRPAVRGGAVPPPPPGATSAQWPSAQATNACGCQSNERGMDQKLAPVFAAN